MNLKSCIFLIITISICNNCFSQNINSKIEALGFKVYSLKKDSKSDSILFVISTPHDVKKPVLLFIQGSLPTPLFSYDKDGYFGTFTSIFPKEVRSKYQIVIVSRTGVPLCREFSKIRDPLDTQSERDLYAKYDNLESRVYITKRVMDFLYKSKVARKGEIFIVGHSEGYHVAAKLAAMYPDKFSKVVCMSSNPFDRQSIKITELKKQQNLHNGNSQSLQNQIDSVYKHQYELKEWYDHWGKSKLKDYNDYCFYNDYSYNFNPSINDLLKIKKPLLVVYGTDDPASNYNELLPLFFARAGKSNLTLKCYYGYDHNYFSTKEGSIEKQYNWPDVFKDIDSWLSKKQ